MLGSYYRVDNLDFETLACQAHGDSAVCVLFKSTNFRVFAIRITKRSIPCVGADRFEGIVRTAHDSFGVYTPPIFFFSEQLSSTPMGHS